VSPTSAHFALRLTGIHLRHSRLHAGAKIIVRRLRAVLGQDASFHFYGDGNGRPEAVWASFCSDLEENRKNDVEAICAVAVAIFDVYAAWLSEPILRAGGR
jgi:hypothetical protein